MALSDTIRSLRCLGWMVPMFAERAAAMTTTDGGKRIAQVAISDGGLGQMMVGDYRLCPIGESESGGGMAIAVAESFQDAGAWPRLARANPCHRAPAEPRHV